MEKVDQEKDSVAVVLYPGCVLLELTLALQLLEKKFQVRAYAPSGGRHTSSLGLEVETRPFSDGPPERCRAVLVPGGDFSSIQDDRQLDFFLQEAHKGGSVIAAICGGVFAPAKAGILRGHSFVHPFGREQLDFLQKYFVGCQPQEKDFLHDGSFLTAQPYAFIDFAVELAARLGSIPPERVIFFKNYYRGFPRGRIRPLALALIRRPNGQLLVHEGLDRVKGEVFYRPLGGGIEFGENAAETVARELEEEIGAAVEVGREIGALENRFTYEGREGHELLLLYEARFQEEKHYRTERFLIDESGQGAGYAVWKSPAEIAAAGAPLYPPGLERFLDGAH